MKGRWALIPTRRDVGSNPLSNLTFLKKYIAGWSSW
jgi:hypothetical protein